MENSLDTNAFDAAAIEKLTEQVTPTADDTADAVPGTRQAFMNPFASIVITVTSASNSMHSRGIIAPAEANSLVAEYRVYIFGTLQEGYVILLISQERCF